MEELAKLPHDKESAAQLIATGGVEKQDIAKKLGISRTTLWNWEKKDAEFMARVDTLKREFESFAQDLIQSRLLDAVEGYWELIQTSDNDRVTADGYRFFIERQLGKTASEVKLTAGADTTTAVDDDILGAEYDDIIDVEAEDVD